MFVSKISPTVFKKGKEGNIKEFLIEMFLPHNAAAVSYTRQLSKWKKLNNIGCFIEMILVVVSCNA